MFIVHVTEAPRTGQRKPRSYWFAIAGANADEARANWKASNQSQCHGCGPADTVGFERADNLPYRFA